MRSNHIHRVRESLSEIDGALIESPPKDAAKGEGDAVVLYDPGAFESDNPVAQSPDGEWSTDLPTGNAEPYFDISAPEDQAAVDAALDGGLGDDIRAAEELNGIDALGWYVPFHYPGVQWGIRLRGSGILSLARSIRSCTKADSQTSHLMAVHLIYRHELFHFAAEYMLAQLEGFYRIPIYVNGSRLFDHDGRYHKLEEALATAYMVRSCVRAPHSKGVKGRKSAFKKILSPYPPGYSDWWRYFEQRDFIAGLVKLAEAHLRNSGIKRPLSHVALERLFPLWPRIPWEWCPYRLVQDGKRYGMPPIGLGYIPYVRIHEESVQFKEQLARLPAAIQKQWRNAVEKLSSSVMHGGLQFKKWTTTAAGSLFSIRVNAGYRAHLLLRSTDGLWIADSIGNHKVMGHG